MRSLWLLMIALSIAAGCAPDVGDCSHYSNPGAACLTAVAKKDTSLTAVDAELSAEDESQDVDLLYEISLECGSNSKDSDGDGVADCLEVAASCPAGAISDKSIFPKAPELCDGKDNDCNGHIDDGCDKDGDGWCDIAKIIVGKPAACPLGGDDCNDANEAVNSGATDVCNGVDDNCDGKTDEGFTCPASGCNIAACIQGKCQSKPQSDGATCSVGSDPVDSICLAGACLSGVCSPVPTAEGQVCGVPSSNECCSEKRCAGGKCIKKPAPAGVAANCGGAECIVSICDGAGASVAVAAADGTPCSSLDVLGDPNCLESVCLKGTCGKPLLGKACVQPDFAAKSNCETTTGACANVASSPLHNYKCVYGIIPEGTSCKSGAICCNAYGPCPPCEGKLKFTFCWPGKSCLVP